MKIINYVKQYAYNTILNMHVTSNIKKMFIFAGGLLFFWLFVYVSCWLFLFDKSNGDIRFQLLGEWREFFSLLLSGGALSVFLTAIKLSIDKNHDGIPDMCENTEDNSINMDIDNVGIQTQDSVTCNGLNNGNSNMR